MKTNISTLVILALLSGSVYAETAVINIDSNAHTHGKREHTHLLPIHGINHKHGKGSIGIAKISKAPLKPQEQGELDENFSPELLHALKVEQDKLDKQAEIYEKNNPISTNMRLSGINAGFNAAINKKISILRGGYYGGDSVSKIKIKIKNGCSELSKSMKSSDPDLINNNTVFKRCFSLLNSDFDNWLKSNYSAIQKIRTEYRNK